MRIIVHHYEDGARHIYETTDDGSQITRHIEGKAQYGDKLSAYVEVSSDNNKQGKKRLIKDLEKTLEILKSQVAVG